MSHTFSWSSTDSNKSHVEIEFENKIADKIDDYLKAYPNGDILVDLSDSKDGMEPYEVNIPRRLKKTKRVFDCKLVDDCFVEEVTCSYTEKEYKNTTTFYCSGNGSYYGSVDSAGNISIHEDTNIESDSHKELVSETKGTLFCRLRIRIVKKDCGAKVTELQSRHSFYYQANIKKDAYDKMYQGAKKDYVISSGLTTAYNIMYALGIISFLIILFIAPFGVDSKIYRKSLFLNMIFDELFGFSITYIEIAKYITLCAFVILTAAFILMCRVYGICKKNHIVWNKKFDKKAAYYDKERKYANNMCVNIWYDNGRIKAIIIRFSLALIIFAGVVISNICNYAGIDSSTMETLDFLVSIPHNYILFIFFALRLAFRIISFLIVRDFFRNCFILFTNFNFNRAEQYRKVCREKSKSEISKEVLDLKLQINSFTIAPEHRNAWQNNNM